MKSQHLNSAVVQHIATHRNTPQHNVTYCNTLQHTATHYNTLQHTATQYTHCNTLQHIATHCNTLQHTATHCNTLQRTRYDIVHLNSARINPSLVCIHMLHTHPGAHTTHTHTTQTPFEVHGGWRFPDRWDSRAHSPEAVFHPYQECLYYIFILYYAHTYYILACVYKHTYVQLTSGRHMGWLRSVGSIKS